MNLLARVQGNKVCLFARENLRCLHGDAGLGVDATASPEPPPPVDRERGEEHPGAGPQSSVTRSEEPQKFQGRIFSG